MGFFCFLPFWKRVFLIIPKVKEVGDWELMPWDHLKRVLKAGLNLKGFKLEKGPPVPAGAPGKKVQGISSWPRQKYTGYSFFLKIAMGWVVGVIYKSVFPGLAWEFPTPKVKRSK